jgi:DNA (cytosine-5)-methyltransferase 1
VLYYNENEPYAAQWLRNLIAKGLIADGEVDERSIVDVRATDLRGFRQCHFFAGLGGWAYALRLAGWPDDRPVWTGSCPCQPFSVAGHQKGFGDPRHLWPDWLRLIAECRPSTIFGEQVARAHDWLARVRSDLEGLEYAVGAMPIEAASVGAPHKRDRYWFVADHESEQVGSARQPRQHIDVANASFQRLNGSGISGATGRGEPPNGGGDMVDPAGERRREGRPKHEIRSGRDAITGAGAWDGAEWLVGADGKARRVKSGVRLLANGVPARVAKLRALGNAIVPQTGAAFVAAYMECRP